MKHVAELRNTGQKKRQSALSYLRAPLPKVAKD